MRAVEDHLPKVSGHDKLNWQDKVEGCCHVIPRTVDLMVKGVHEVAGTLLSILSILIFSIGTVFDLLSLGRSMSQTRGSHSSLTQSHLKSETGQRRGKNKIKIRFCLF